MKRRFITFAEKENVMPELTEGMLDAIEEAEDQFQTVRDSFDDFEKNKRFENPNQRIQHAESVKIALMNSVKIKNQIMGDSDAKVKSLRTTIGKAQESINDALKDIQNIKKTLNTITKALNVVASVVATLK
jgi:hypothetical protein